MKYLPNLKLIFVLLGTCVPATAYPHTGNTLSGFESGLLHPVLGLDHFLAMISVGIVSAQFGGRALWLIPATFVTVMLLGGITGILGIYIMAVETAIAISVIVLGIAITAQRYLSWHPVFIAVAFFAIFHGHAHGLEIPVLAKPVLYVAGFVSGTAAIHLAGVLFGVIANKYDPTKIALPITGLLFTGAGIYMLASN